MKKLLLILLCFPMIGFGQTNVPDSAFEAFLEINGYGNGIANDSIVSTVMISYATILNVSNYSISNLKGIEDFVILEGLDCSNNQLTNLNVSQNLTLTILNCSSNQLTSLDVRNGNNMNMPYFYTTNNPNLTCINVDDVAYSTTSWTDIDPQHYFSNNCAIALGCTDPLACNYDALTTIDDSSCIYGTSSSSYDTISFLDSIIWNNLLVLVSGTYYSILINSAGCDSTAYLYAISSTTGISDIANSKSNLVKITDMLGQETPYRRNTPLFYIYDDGTVEKRIVIE